MSGRLACCVPGSTDRMTTLDPPARRSPPPFSGWSPRALILFGSLMVVLTGVGLFGRFHHSHGPSGFPRDAAVDSARAALHSGLPVQTMGLRFPSSFDMDEHPRPLPDSVVESLASASRWMAVARS